jgi:hypothetical protein
MKPELVNFRLPAAGQNSVAVDTLFNSNLRADGSQRGLTPKGADADCLQ